MREQRSLVDVADRVQPVVAVDPQLVVDLDPVAFRAGRPSRARCRRCWACRPAATMRRSASIVSPLVERHVDPTVLARGVRDLDARCARRRPPPSALPRAPPRRTPPRRQRVAAPLPGAPRRRRASSRPAPARNPPGPPPITIRLSGTSFAVVASRFVHGSASASPGIGGSERAGAGGDDDGLAGGEDVVARNDAALAVQPSLLAEELDAPVLEPGKLDRVVEVVDDLVAPREHLVRSRRVGRELDPGHPADLADQLAGPDERLRGHARVVGALPADQVRARRARRPGRRRQAGRPPPRPKGPRR